MPGHGQGLSHLPTTLAGNARSLTSTVCGWRSRLRPHTSAKRRLTPCGVCSRSEHDDCSDHRRGSAGLIGHARISHVHRCCGRGAQPLERPMTGHAADRVRGYDVELSSARRVPADTADTHRRRRSRGSGLGTVPDPFRGPFGIERTAPISLAAACLHLLAYGRRQHVAR